MDLKAGLWQQQTLKLAMTQELSQAIALLQYSAQELTAFLEEKSLENPLLQIENENIQPVNPLVDRQKKKHRIAEKDWIEQMADKSFSLEEQLMTQINTKKCSNEQMKAIRFIIQSLDDNGYFLGDIEAMAETLNVSPEAAEDGLAIIQTLDPSGIGARNLQECLLLQLKENELAEIILSDYFFPFAEKKWKVIAKELQVSMQEIQAVFDTVQLLNPRPGAMLKHDRAAYIIPDAILERTADGLVVRIYDDFLPKISFNHDYYKKFTAAEDAQVSRFLNNKFQDYQWILRSIEQRKETLTKVISKIVEKQFLFFQKGPGFLRPMTMKEIAGELDIHESTVSRAVREKFVQTPVGTFSLKSFFTSTIQTVKDDLTSSTKVKNVILNMIGEENKLKPISDQEIADILKQKEGIVISRRTVAKYREQIGIPSSSKRRRF